MINELIKLADNFDISGNLILANKIDLLIKKISMHHGAEYLRCDNFGCNNLFMDSHPKAMRTEDGRDLCPSCARSMMGGGFESEIPVPKPMEPFGKRYRHYGDKF